MALSNWDTLAFDHEGKSCDGEFVREGGDAVEIYKNWLYVRSPKLWKPDPSYHTNDVIAEIHVGEMKVAGFDISAERGPQHGVFVFLEYGPYPDRKIGGGIGCSGYEDIVARILKENNRTNENLENWTSGSTSKEGGGWQNHLVNWTTGEEINFEGETQWVGVLPETLEAYFAWVERTHEKEEKDVMEWLEKCRAAPAQRFNQGDAFFAKHLGFETPATEIGKVETPVLEQMLKKDECA
jgi:hypothetical protein